MTSAGPAALRKERKQATGGPPGELKAMKNWLLTTSSNKMQELFYFTDYPICRICVLATNTESDVRSAVVVSVIFTWVRPTSPFYEAWTNP